MFRERDIPSAFNSISNLKDLLSFEEMVITSLDKSVERVKCSPQGTCLLFFVTIFHVLAKEVKIRIKDFEQKFLRVSFEKYAGEVICSFLIKSYVGSMG